jgi:hypothetical protein
MSSLVDLVAGTSNGGIIALGLTKPDGNGEPKYSAKEIAELYRTAPAASPFVVALVSDYATSGRGYHTSPSRQSQTRSPRRSSSGRIGST